MARKRKAPKVPREAKAIKEYDDVDPDQAADDYYHDDVDQFNNEREKILLGDTLQPRKKLKQNQEQEVLPLNDVEDDDELEEDIAKMSNIISRLRRQKEYKVSQVLGEELEEEDEETDTIKTLSTAWGSKPKDFYGDDSEEEFDDEANDSLQMPNEYANRQKFELDQIDETDFDFDRYKISKPAETESVVTTIQKDVSKMTTKEQQELVKKESPELVPIFTDTIKRCEEAENIIYPIVEAYNKGLLPQHALFVYLQNKLSLYMNHFANVAFYRMLKLEKVDVRQHPVVEMMFNFIKVFKKYETTDRRITPLLKDILKKVKMGKLELVLLEDLQKRFKGAEASPDNKLAKKTSKSVTFAMGDSEEAAKEEEADDNEEVDRTVDYAIAKNKGLTPKRKKENRNPRVKNRRKYERALARRRGQVRPQRQELTPYAGELSGIKAGIKRGIRLH